MKAWSARMEESGLKRCQEDLVEEFVLTLEAFMFLCISTSVRGGY